jgi:peptide/nickel transport system permease protein
MSHIEEPVIDAGASVGLAANPAAARERDLDGRREGRARAMLTYLGRRPGLTVAIVWIALVVVAAFFPGLIAPDNPLGISVSIKTAPSWHHVFGTDEIGRDLFSRVAYGASLSLRAALIAIGVGLVVGGVLGLLAGYAGGWADSVLMRFVDVLLAIPALLLSLAIVITLGFGLTNVAIAVGSAFVASSARVMRGEVLKVRQSPFIEAARIGGARRFRVLWRHILPNAVEPVLVLAAMEFGEAILYVSTLSFLGYGVQPPAPEWGALVADGRDYLNTSWWLTTMPGLTIVATVLAANRISRAFAEASS